MTCQHKWEWVKPRRADEYHFRRCVKCGRDHFEAMMVRPKFDGWLEKLEYDLSWMRSNLATSERYLERALKDHDLDQNREARLFESVKEGRAMLERTQHEHHIAQEVGDDTVLLIAGSRHTTPAMLDFVSNAVHRAIENSWWVLVGDNPNGVDARAIDTLNTLRYPHAICMAPKNWRFRRRLDYGHNTNAGRTSSYAVRDEYMCDIARKAMFIWDGRSQGTKAGCDYFRREWAERECWLKDFSTSQIS